MCSVAFPVRSMYRKLAYNHGVILAEPRPEFESKTSESESDFTPRSNVTYFKYAEYSTKSPGMSSQRSRAPRGGARAGTHETGEEAQLWNDMQEKLLKLEKNEARSKELGKEIFDKEASIKAQEDAGISKESASWLGIY